MKKIRNGLLTVALTLIALFLAVSCPHGDDNAVKGTAKLISSQTVAGAKNVEIYSTTFTIKLADGAKFLSLEKGLDVKSWFNPQVPGLTYRVESDVKEDSDTIKILVEGIPTETSNNTITIIVPYQMKEKAENGSEVVTPIIKNGTQNIVVTDYKEGSKTLDPQSKYAIGETQDKPVATLQNSLIITGQQGLAFTQPYSANIKLDTGRFVEIGAGTDVHTWFSPNYYPDLEYKVLNNVRKNSNAISIQITGTPKEVSKLPLKITIPSESLIEKEETVVSVVAGGSLSYNIIDEAASATLKAKVEIEGSTGIELQSKDFTIALQGATFKVINKGYNVGEDESWVVNPKISGLTYTVKNTLSDDTSSELTITVSGTPKVGSESALSITIPKSAIVLPKDRENEVKELVVNTLESVYRIKGPKAEIRGDETKILLGREGIEIEPFEFTVDLTDIQFKAFTKESVKNEFPNWFGESLITGLNYELKEDVPQGATSLTVVISGKPQNTSTKLISMVIPKARFIGASSTLVDIPVNMKSAQYNISSLFATMPFTKIEGGKLLKMQDQEFVITLDGDGALFNPITSDENVTWISPLVDGITFTLKANTTESKTVKIVASGTPSVTSESVFQINIPSRLVKNAENDVVVTTNNSRYDVVDISANVDSSLLISGKKNMPLTTATEIKVNVLGAKLNAFTKQKFESEIETWMSPIITGLTYALKSDVSDNSSSFSIMVSGTPTVASSDIISIRIPKAYIKNAGDTIESIGVDTKNSKYQISESSAEIVNPITITGVTNIAKKTQTFTVKLTNEKFKAMTNKKVDWFKDVATGIEFKVTATEGSEVATVTVSGTPTKISTADLSGSIKQADLQDNGGLTDLGLTIDVNGSVYNISTLRLKTDTVTVGGTSGNVAIEPKTFVITFDDASEELTFKTASEATLDTTWINTIVKGLTFTKKAITSVNNKEIAIEVSGIPEEDNGSEITITLPNASNIITGYSSTTTPNVTVDTQGSRYAISSLYAQLSNAVTVSGYKDKTIDSKKLTVNLVNSEFSKDLAVGTSVSDWFTISGGANGYEGLSYKISKAVKANDTQAEVEISGCPEVVVPGVSLVMEIPASYLTKTSNSLKVDTRGSLYRIDEISASSNEVVINGTQNVSISEKTFTLTLTNGIMFKAIPTTVDLDTTWMKIVDGLEYKLLQNASRSNTASILVRGLPTQTVSEPIAITIPPKYIEGMRENAPSISVDTNGSVYAIDTLSASVDSAVTVSGTKNIALTERTITINLTGAKFNALSAGSTKVEEWITTKVPGVTYALRNSIPSSSSTDTSDTATIRIYGTPRSVADAVIGITIPSSYIKNASRNVVVDTKESKFAVSDITATVDTAVMVSGSQNTEIATKTMTVTLKGDATQAPTFKAVSSDTAISGWFTDNVPGLKYTLKKNTSASSTITIEISGTPTAMVERVITLTIPKDRITNYDTANGSDIVVNTNGSMYNIADLSANLQGSSNDVTGSRNIVLTNKEVTIELQGTTFASKNANADVSKWFVTSVKGLSFKLKNALTSGTSTTATVVISGTPEEITDRKAIQVVLPKTDLTKASSDIIVNTNNAVYDIKGVTASVSSMQTISGYRDITITSKSFTINLQNATFASRSDLDVKSWFTPQIAGLSYKLNTQIADGATSAVVTVSGTPSEVINNATITVTIPESAIKNATTGKFGTLSVDTKGSTFTFEDWSLKTNEVVVKGTDSGVGITEQTMTITFDKNVPGLTFKNASAAPLDDTWVSPILGGLTFKRAQITSSNNKSITITISGTPTASSSQSISVVLPNAANIITGYSNASKPNVEVNTNGSRYAITSLFATLTNKVDVTGYQYFPITSKTVEVSLSEATFKNNLTVGTDVKDWFTANYKGLSYKIAEAVTAGSKSAKVTISGTPEVTLSNIGMSMNIPVSYLSGTTTDLSVDTLGSTYSVNAISASTTNTVISGSKDVQLASKTFTITLSNAKFTSLSQTDVSSWFSHAVQGLTYTLQANSSVSNTARIVVTGTPTETFAELIQITIKNNSLIQNYSSTAPNVVVAMDNSRYNISSLNARVASAKTISGTKDVKLSSSVEYTINLTGSVFNSVIGNVSSWVSGTVVQGLTYTLKSNPSGKNQAVIVVDGTPSALSTASFNITIPKAAIKDATQDVSVDMLTSAYNIGDLSASATSSITVSGSQNALITSKTLTIKLTGSTFTALTSSTEDNARSWFADPIDGLKYTRKVNATATDTIQIEISGTPESISTRAIEVTIPRTVITAYDQTKSGINVNTLSSRYAIGSIKANLRSKIEYTGTRQIQKSVGQVLVVELNGATFNALKSSADVSDWFTTTVPGLKYFVNADVQDGESVVSLQINGTPTATSTSVLQMEIPSKYIKNATTDVIVDTLSSVYNIKDVSATLDAKQTISGVANITLKERDAFTVTLSNATFASMASGYNVSSWFTPAIDGLTYTLSQGISAGATSLKIKVAGRPTSESSETMSIRIPRSVIQYSSTSLSDITVDTKNSVYAISSASATISSAKTITGIKDITPTSSQSFEIALTSAKFTSLNLTGTSARSWFTNPIDGFTYAISASANSSTATVTISGTPTITSNASIGVIIPKAYLTFDGGTASKDIVVDANGSVYSITSVSAAITSSSAVTISGIKDATITNQTLTVSLTNATFKNASASDVKSWITPSIDGLAYAFTRSTSNTKQGTITISGTPTKESAAVISIDIPSSQIVNASQSFAPLSVDTKNSHYTISATEATIASNVTIKGTRNIALQTQNQSFRINIKGATFKSFTNKNVTSWVTNNVGLTYTATSSSDGTYVTVTVSGTPQAASVSTLSLVIDTASLSGTVKEAVVVNTKGLVFSIDEVGASLNSQIEIDGILNKPLTASVSGTVTLSGNDAKFTGLSTTTTFGSTFTQPVIAGLTYKITSVSEKSFTFIISGTPTVLSTSTIALTIPKANITGVSSAFQSVVNVDTKNSIYNINEASATISSTTSTTSAATISAVQNVALSTYPKLQINLEETTFTAKSAGSDVTSWFTNSIDGLTYKIDTALTSTSKTAVIRVEGTPRVQSNERIVVKLPIGSTALTKELIADSQGSVYNITSASATVKNKIVVAGSSGAEIPNGTYQFDIDLTGVTFADVTDLDVSSWFAPQIPGLTYKLASGLKKGATTASVIVAGTPTSSSEAVVAISIKNSALNGATNLGDLTVNAKESAYNIQAVTLTFSKDVIVNGFTNVPFLAETFDIVLSGVGFAALERNADISSWFTQVEGMKFVVDKATTKGDKTLTVSVYGIPKKGSTAHINVSQAALQLDTPLTTNITIDTKNSVYNIIDVTASFASKVQVNGAKNIEILPTNNMFKINLNGIKFESLSAGENVTSWVSPKVDGLTFVVNEATGADSSSVTIKPQGTATVSLQNAVWTVTIPKGKLKSYTQDLTVDPKGSLWNIIEPEAEIEATTHIVGSKGIEMDPTYLTINLKNGVKFNSLTTTADLRSWFDPNLAVPGLTYQPASAVTTGATSIRIVVEGTPELASNKNALKIVIPPNAVYYDDVVKQNKQSISVDIKGSEYQIAEGVVNARVNLSLTSDIEMEPQIFEVHLRGTELEAIQAGTDITDWFSFSKVELNESDSKESQN